jgi:hypothetical protein
MSQKTRLLEWLKRGYSISRLEGWEKLGILELPARVCELRQEGYDIQTQMMPVTNRYGETVRIAVWSL